MGRSGILPPGLLLVCRRARARAYSMAKCDSCGRTHGDRRDSSDDDEEEIYLEKCDDCGWVVCDPCSYNKHHGPCRCLNSDMGNAYADMDGPAPYMGASGGARYTGPFKCAAQREMEALLMMDRHTGGRCLTKCCEPTCGALLLPTAAKLCTRCRSAIYCSAACQRTAWTTPRGVHGSHKECCGAYLPPEQWPYHSRDFLAYFEHWGRYPTAKPTPAQRASDEMRISEEARISDEQRALGGSRISTLDAQLNAARDAADAADAADGADAADEDEAADEEARRAYLREREAMLGQMQFPTEAALGHADAMERAAEAAEAVEAAESAGAEEVEGAAEAAAAAEMAARLLGQVTLDGGGEAAEDEEDEEEVPMMTAAEASARAREILAQTRRDFGRLS